MVVGWLLNAFWMIYGWSLDDYDSNLISTLDLMSRHHKFLAYQKERQYDVVLKFSSRSWPPGKSPCPQKTSDWSSLVGLIPCISVDFKAKSGHSQVLLPMLPHYLIAICMSGQQSLRTFPSTLPHDGLSWFHCVAPRDVEWLPARCRLLCSRLRSNLCCPVEDVLGRDSNFGSKIPWSQSLLEASVTPCDTPSNMITWGALGGLDAAHFQVIWWPFSAQWAKPWQLSKAWLSLAMKRRPVRSLFGVAREWRNPQNLQFPMIYESFCGDTACTSTLWVGPFDS